MIADGHGRAIAFRFAPGRRMSCRTPYRCSITCRACPSGSWPTAATQATPFASTSGTWARPAIPPRRNEAPVACPDYIYTNRNLVERLWARLKEWRAVATRYEKTARSFMGVLCMAAAMDWLKS